MRRLDWVGDLGEGDAPPRLEDAIWISAETCFATQRGLLPASELAVGDGLVGRCGKVRLLEIDRAPAAGVAMVWLLPGVLEGQLRPLLLDADQRIQFRHPRLGPLFGVSQASLRVGDLPSCTRFASEAGRIGRAATRLRLSVDTFLLSEGLWLSTHPDSSGALSFHLDRNELDLVLSHRA